MHFQRDINNKPRSIELTSKCAISRNEQGAAIISFTNLYLWYSTGKTINKGKCLYCPNFEKVVPLISSYIPHCYYFLWMSNDFSFGIVNTMQHCETGIATCNTKRYLRKKVSLIGRICHSEAFVVLVSKVAFYFSKL